MTTRTVAPRPLLAAGAFALTTLACAPAAAANYGLIMWIQSYAPPNTLSGIDLDAGMAHDMLTAMNVPPGNVIEYKNEQLTLGNLSHAIKDLTDRIQKGDNVFIFTSMHGFSGVPTSDTQKKCSQGLVSQDLQIYWDRDIKADLDHLADKASQVVMLNDSCHSGGAATKALWRPGDPRPKYVELPQDKAAAQGVTDQDCARVVNEPMTKNFIPLAVMAVRWLYLAASRDNEVSWSTSRGSVATQAWSACLKNGSADTDHSNSISGEELRACAQRIIDSGPPNLRQTITVVGNGGLPLAFPPAGPGAAPIDAQHTLKDIQAAADPTYKVALTPVKGAMRIGQDSLDFKVQTERDGYLYIFQVGSDGKTFNLLFPNDVDTDNHLAKGQYSFPRPTWRLASQGPAGTDYLMALVSAEPRDFRREMANHEGPFSTAQVAPQGAKNLVIVATGGGTHAGGNYGASEVVAVKEVAP